MNTLKQLVIFYMGVFQIASVEADFLIMIRIHNFTTHCKECGTYFRYCVQESDENVECQESYDVVHPGIRLDFSREFLLLRSNPIAFWGHTDKWQGAQVQVTAIDQYASEDSNEVLCEAHVNLTTNNIQVGIETIPVTYTGPMGQSNITISFSVVCAEYWYGQYCNFWCSQDKNCECDLSVPCHNNCLGVVCGENRHCVDGVDIYVCTCDSGFTGKQCEIQMDECEGVSCSENADEDTILVWVIGAVGWTLFISLGLIVIIALIYVKAKRNDNSCIQPEGCPTSTTASTNPTVFYPRHNALDIVHEELHQSISHPATTPIQSSGASATRVIASSRRNIKMTRNRAYQSDGYEYTNETST